MTKYSLEKITGWIIVILFGLGIILPIATIAVAIHFIVKFW
jgi:hypothetical protein